MELIENFMKNFDTHWKNNDKDELAKSITNAIYDLGLVAKDDAERALEIIFDKKNALFKLINTVCLNKNDYKNFAAVLKECFDLFKSAMQIFKCYYEPYIMQTLDACFSCIKSFTLYFTKKHAAEALSKLIELFPNYDMQLNNIIEHYKEKKCLYTSKDIIVFYSIIGAIARYCPKIENVIPFVDLVCKDLLKDSKNLYNPDKSRQLDDIKYHFDCFSNILVNFVPYENDHLKQHSYFEEFYNFLLTLCKSNKISKVLKRKIIYLVNTNMKHFAPFIFKNYEKWHDLLNNDISDIELKYKINALRAFYKTMAMHVLIEDSEDVFLYFKNYIMLNIYNKNLPNYKLLLLVYALGEFSAAYAKYLPSEISDIFQLIAYQTLPFYTMDVIEDKFFESITDYMLAMSCILRYTTNVSLHQLNNITAISVHFIKKFPELKIKKNSFSLYGLKDTFVNISHLKKELQQEYFNSFFYQGILWSCSHTLSIDVELKQEIDKLAEPPICYKNFLPLWNALFTMDRQETYSPFLVSEIFNEFVLVLITFIKKLNLNVTTQEDNYGTFLLKAENESDFWFFVNLVDLYVDVFEKIESVLFKNWTVKLVIFLIKYSYKYPMISGFYKLINVIFKKPDVFIECKDNLSKTEYELISQYLSDILPLVQRFSSELQLSCIYLICNSPTCFITQLINQVIPVFKTAFNIGLTDLSLAVCALDTLEKWTKSSDIKCSNIFFENIISYVEPYLASDESSIDTFYDIIKHKKTKIRIIENDNVDENLKTLQKKILLFYGSLDSNILHKFIHIKSIDTNASWNKKNLLQCELLFPDIRLEILFDKFIPRIIELIKSGDRKTKFAACEFLYNTITIILGKKLVDECFNKELCNIVLILGCDPDDAVKTIYHPLVLQLTHYFSSKFMKESRVPQEFLDLLFDGLNDEFNPSMRDHCSIYLKEFVEWSIKQSSENDILIIVRRITNMALYPSNKKRLAAAMAFNRLYTILRENSHIVNVYWLEFLHAFVKSMEECDDIQIVNALGHIEKVIIVKSNLFNAKFNHRRVPPEFQDETLKGTLIWLFNYCGSTSIKCRRKCIELFENLLPIVSNSENIKQTLVKDINVIALKNVVNIFEYITITSAKSFLKALDFYIWVFKKKLLPSYVSVVMEEFSKSQGIFSRCFNNFVSIIINKNSEKYPEEYTSSYMETEMLLKLRSEIILKVIEFVSTIINEEEQLMSNLWSSDLYLLIIHCILHPREIGLNARNLQIIEQLPRELEHLLISMKSLSELYSQPFIEMLLFKMRKNLTHYTKIHNIIYQEANVHELQQFVDGLLILKKCKFIDFEKEHNITTTFIIDYVNIILESLKFEVLGSDTCKELNEHVKNYLNVLMKFFLEDYQYEIVKTLTVAIMNNIPLKTLKGSTTTNGEYFLEIFKTPIIQYFLKDPKSTLEIFDETLVDNPDKLLFLIEELVTYAHTNKKNNSEELADEIFKRFNNYCQILNNIDTRKDKLFNINRIAIALKSKPREAIKNEEPLTNVYLWIVSELINSKELDKKTHILQNFYMCLVDVNSNKTNRELLIIIQRLRDDDWLQKLESNETLRFNTVKCFKVLLKILSNTICLSMFEGVTRYSAGIYKYLCKENVKEHINLYFLKATDETAFCTLEIAYKIFMELNTIDERLDVLNQFLLPSIKCSKFPIIDKFYDNRHREMVAHVSKKINSIECAEDRKKTIVTKIGCYNIFELIYAKFDMKPMSLNDKPIISLIAEQTVEERATTSKSNEEKEITRLLHCSALNCIISIFSLKTEDKFYSYIFYQNRGKDILIWERIVDCEKNYNFYETSSTLRRNRKILLNIRNKIRADESEGITCKFERSNLSLLTFVEDPHLYDLNDARVSDDSRLNVSLESDELVDHECLPTIIGIFMQMFNNEVVPLDDRVDNDNLPPSLRMFRNAFSSENDNVRIFLMKIVTSTKNAFVPYMKSFYRYIANLAYMYLRNNRLNYIVRDTLVLLIESKYQPIDQTDVELAQALIERLIGRIEDPQKIVYKYNVELFESLCRAWRHRSILPSNLGNLIKENRDLATNVIVVLLRNEWSPTDLEYVNFIKRSIEEWRDDKSIVLLRFEALGWLMRYTKSSADEFLRVFQVMCKVNPIRCAHCVCAVYEACPSENQCASLFQFVNPRLLPDDRKYRCIELLFHRLPHLSSTDLHLQLNQCDLLSVLRNRIVGCEAHGLNIVDRLLDKLPPNELKPYLDLVRGFTGCTNLLEYRLLAYNVLAKAYTIFPKLTVETFVSALEDPTEEIQQIAINFWRERVKLADTTVERLLELLEFYTPEISNGFTRFLCLIMLELTSKSLDDKRVMFKPLADGTFRDYEPLLAWRKRNLGSMAPMFAPSLTHQLEMFTQTSSSFEGSLKLMATMNLEFESTVRASSTQTSGYQSKKKLPDPSENVLSKRLIIKESSPADLEISYVQTKQNMHTEHREKVKREMDRRRNEIKHYRKYRIGDFPDVELTHASFIDCLRQFITRDWLSCKDFAVVLVCSLMNRLKDGDKYEHFIATISTIFQRVLRLPDGNFVHVVMEIILNSKVIDFNDSAVGQICRKFELHSLGILLLEEKSLRGEILERDEKDEPPALKKRRTDSEDKWLELASLYKSIGDRDTVKSIFEYQLKSTVNPDFRNAALAQGSNCWLDAKNYYEKAYDSTSNEYCLEGMFECMRELSSWSSIIGKTKTILDNDFATVWTSPRRDQLLPWIFEAHMLQTLTKITSIKKNKSQVEFDGFDEWVHQGEPSICKQFSEEIAVVILCSQLPVDKARQMLKNSFENVRIQWVRTSLLAKNARIDMIKKLRGMYNINAYIETIKASDMEQEVSNLIKYWDNHLPDVNDDCLSWNKHILYRLTFTQRLYEKFKTNPDDSESSVPNDLLSTIMRHRIKMGELAISNKNKIVAKTHISSAEMMFDNISIDWSSLKSDFELLASKYKHLCGQAESLAKKKCNYYVGAWEIAENISVNEDNDISTKIDHHLFDVLSDIKNSVEDDRDFAKILKSQEYVLSRLNVKCLVESIQQFCFDRLKNSCKTAESFAKFGKYCYNLLTEATKHDRNLSKELVASMLFSMSLGSYEAAQYFPCLLNEDYYEDNSETTKIFKTESENVPTWVFLPWRSQILSYLGKIIAPLLLPIVRKLVAEYPNAMLFDFRQTYEAQPELKRNPEIRKMYESLFGNVKLEKFFDAMHRVCQPEHYLKHCLEQISDVSSVTIDSIITDIFEENPMQGKLYNCLEKYKNELEKLKNVENDIAKKNLLKLSMDLYESMKRRIKEKGHALQLKDYSPFLSRFSGDDIEIEIPGQYDGNGKPIPRYHKKISKFDRFVRVMDSKCNPIKINVIGNDAKIYGFLVKFGEDLRQDQRLQQIFNIINKTLSNDSNCRSGHLSVNTYHVVPLSKSLGLIQWVDGTKVLREFIEFSMTDKSMINIVASKYREWIEKAGKSARSIENYKKALIQYDSVEVISKMKEFIGYFDWDCLRKTFTMICPSMESFVTLRRNFIANYATMCIVHWITGVGDRHLENMLIKVNSGMCYGIDFGLAFGTGVDQSIPELVPFRLTSQILGLFRPFDENALFGVTMTKVLKSLRNEKGPMLAYLNVFVNEPLDWGKNINKQMENYNEQQSDIKWLPKQKISTVEKKLNGNKPTAIMLEELAYTHNTKDEEECLSKYKIILNGCDENGCLTPEEQVQCLLKQATDLNILGRMYEGWTPFV